MAATDAPSSPAPSAAASDEGAATSPSGANRDTSAGEQRHLDYIMNLVSALPAAQLLTCQHMAQDSNLNELRAQRKALQKQRAELSRKVKAEQKKKSRLLEKAQRFSNNELLEVFAMRVKRRQQEQTPGTSSGRPRDEQP